jgi:hypothetical protein
MIAEHGEYLKERYRTDDVYFAVWLHAVNRAVERRVAVSFDILEDWDYISAYESDMSPRDTAIQMLQDNGWGFDEGLS